MKFCFAFIMMLIGAGSSPVFSNETNSVNVACLPAMTQMGPIYFIRQFPERLKHHERVDLSFMKSSIISTYRYRLEIPGASQSGIDKRLLGWSAWSMEDISKIIIPNLDAEGGYKFIVEYKTKAGDETKRFEKSFYVYSTEQTQKTLMIESKQETASEDKTSSRNTPDVNRKGIAYTPSERNAKKEASEPLTTYEKAKSVTNRTATENKPPVNEKKPDKKVQAPVPKTQNSQAPEEGKAAAKLPQSEEISGISERTTGEGKLTPEPDETVKRQVSPADRFNINPAVLPFAGGINKGPANITGLASTSLDPLAITQRDEKEYYDFIYDPYEVSQFAQTEIGPVIRNSSIGESNSQENGHLRKAPDFDPDLAGTIKKAEKLPLLISGLLKLSASGSLTDKTALKNPVPADSLTAENTGSEYAVTTENKESIRQLLPEEDLKTEKGMPDNNKNNTKENYTGATETDDLSSVMKESAVDEDLESRLKAAGISVNTTDSNGNTPLHLTVLTGRNREAAELIKHGADPNLLNNNKLSPIHLAILTRNEAIVKELLSNGADINLKGNNGYTPLHIASELNYPELAKDLVKGGAVINIRTSQGLTAKEIAKIQNNNDIIKILRKTGQDSAGLNEPATARNVINYKSAENYSGFHFNLPYDNDLAKKRKLNKNLQFISVPMLTLGIAGISYLKTRADHFYDLSKIAGTEEMAKGYYDKTRKFDKYANITIGVSIVSAYGLIHSTIKKKAVSGKMKKTFNH